MGIEKLLQRNFYECITNDFSGKIIECFWRVQSKTDSFSKLAEVLDKYTISSREKGLLSKYACDYADLIEHEIRNYITPGLFKYFIRKLSINLCLSLANTKYHRYFKKTKFHLIHINHQREKLMESVLTSLIDYNNCSKAFKDYSI